MKLFIAEKPSLAQAIEEGYILDVFKNYVTYEMYYKIIKKTPDNPELDNGKAIAVIKKFVTLEPHNINEKTKIIMEHFSRITKNKIGGKAKAMVVTASRLHAVKYYFAIRDYIEKTNISDINILVAFSGEVQDDGKSYTEVKLNHTKDGKSINEKALPEVFHGDDFQILIVAEKYQTGFDEPLLHTMFVDKKLEGIKAVQTLSRLNRTHKDKEDTFILDFVNNAEDIGQSFQPFYESTILSEGTDPDIVYDMKSTLDNYRIYSNTDIEAVNKVFYSSNKNINMGHLAVLLKPTLDKYLTISEKSRQETFKTLLARFNRVYSFITQIARMFDKDIHQFSIFAHFLEKVLPKRETDNVDIKDILSLEYYKLKKNFDGDIKLQPDENGIVKPIIGGDGSTITNKKNPLNEIINNINRKYGTNFTAMDKVLSQFHDDFLVDDKAINFAKNNDESMFYTAYYKNRFEDIVFNRFQQNDEFAKFVMSNEDVLSAIMKQMLPLIYQDLRKSHIAL